MKRRTTHIVDTEEEQAKGEERPDENVGKDAGDQAVLVRHHDGAIPVDGDKGPGERARDDGGVDEAGVSVVAEVERDEVDEVEDEHHLGPVKVRVDKEVDKEGVQQVVDDEVAADARGGVDILGVVGEEVADVAELEEEEDDPASWARLLAWSSSGGAGGGAGRNDVRTRRWRQGPSSW